MKTAPSARLPKGCATFQAQPCDLKMRAGSSVVSKSLQSDDQSGQAYPFGLLLKDYYCRRGAEGRNPRVREGVQVSRARSHIETQTGSLSGIGTLPYPRVSAYCLLLSAFSVAIISENWLNYQSSCETGRTF